MDARYAVIYIYIYIYDARYVVVRGREIYSNIYIYIHTYIDISMFEAMNETLGHREMSKLWISIYIL